MSKIIAIVLLVVLIVVLFFIIKIFAQTFKDLIAHLPKGILILLLFAIIGAIVYLLWFVFTDEARGGNPGAEGGSETQEELAASEDLVMESVEKCIILRDDQIWIDNQQVEIEYVSDYIDDCVESVVPIVIVDDYSLSSLHHTIVDLCNKKGVQYSLEDETWLQ